MVETEVKGGVLEVVVNNPPVNALAAGVRQGLVEALVRAEGDDGISDRDPGRGASVLGRSRHHRVRQGDRRADPACGGRRDRGVQQTCRGRHSRDGAWRRSRSRAELPLPHRHADGTARGSRGEAWNPARCRRHPAPAAPHRDRTCARDDRVRQPYPRSQGRGAWSDRPDRRGGCLAQEAIAFARTLTAVRRTGNLPLSPDEAAFERFTTANARKLRGLDAPVACIEAVRAATCLPLAEGQKAEMELFRALVAGDQSKALRHIFFAERAAASIAGLPKDVALRPVQSVGIIGAGTMGGGIAMNFLSAGLPVVLVETNQEALDRGVALVRKNYEASAAKGRMKPEQVERAMSLLTPTLAFGALGACDLVIEAVYENMDIKKEIFARLDATMKAGAILASNTSYLSIDEIASVTQRPQDVLGLHFFSPANVMKLLEVVRGAKTAPDVLATCMSIARKIGETPVVAGVCYGFIGNRMLIPRFDQAFKLLNEGASPEQIDKVNTDFGLPMGPFQMADLSGTDLGWHRDPARIESMLDALCARGRFGQKANAGFYDYDAKRRPIPSPVVAEIIDGFRKRVGATPRPISDEEIVVRTIYTMINEGAKIVEEGIAQRPSDVDVVYVYGYGWPAHKGGPMFWGDHVGASAIVAAFRAYEEALGPEFTIAPLLLRSAAEEKTLAEVAA